ncbi:MAG: hypothetical protein GY716_25655 [bacterium]|nr:hypothetical protein [bacterium]
MGRKSDLIRVIETRDFISGDWTRDLTRDAGVFYESILESPDEFDGSDSLRCRSLRQVELFLGRLGIPEAHATAIVARAQVRIIRCALRLRSKTVGVEMATEVIHAKAVDAILTELQNCLARNPWRPWCEPLRDGLRKLVRLLWWLVFRVARSIGVASRALSHAAARVCAMLVTLAKSGAFLRASRSRSALGDQLP